MHNEEIQKCQIDKVTNIKKILNNHEVALQDFVDQCESQKGLLLSQFQIYKNDFQKCTIQIAESQSNNMEVTQKLQGDINKLQNSNIQCQRDFMD